MRDPPSASWDQSRAVHNLGFFKFGIKTMRLKKHRPHICDFQTSSDSKGIVIFILAILNSIRGHTLREGFNRPTKSKNMLEVFLGEQGGGASRLAFQGDNLAHYFAGGVPAFMYSQQGRAPVLQAGQAVVPLDCPKGSSKLISAVVVAVDTLL